MRDFNIKLTCKLFTMKRKFWMVVIFSFLALDIGEAIRWLSLQHSHLHWNLTAWSLQNSPGGRGVRSGDRSPCAVARRRYGLARAQARLCRTAPDAMPHVQQAARLAVDTCQQVFGNRRWNCSSVASAPYLTPDLTRATREQAYVYAISSAAVVWAVARACSSGALHQCTCAPRPSKSPAPTQKFQWGGCGDNIKWGSHFSKRFIDAVEKSTLEKNKKSRRDEISESERILRSYMALVNLHNNKVGRKIMSESLRTQCKCHGVSGSCNIKTCWRALPSMTEIGMKMLQKYTNAIEVKRGFLEKISSEEKKKKRNSSAQLVYISKSPDYCTKDEKLGSFGTVGRTLQCIIKWSRQLSPTLLRKRL
ncbi:unnamed protein product [Acanthoscelides obtectus]|uniref:Protein Wnt n=1 Tax=Acanthoscelides obtectus TaxID=200917 RepID=A0A9P0KQP1_ACAOB|nr:unnamed protein product [Acanthoscelides obtectus]CAK1634324.1 Protein Wnt-11b-2 [Acanthoscelides obtectus]